MIESPVITEWQAEAMHRLILSLLEDRFGPVPADLQAALTAIIMDLDRLIALNTFAARCPDLDAFRRELAAGANNPAPAGPGQGQPA
jgi:hypothetical protein